MIPSVVIISTFKPLLPEFIVEHTNSLKSWKRLRCKPKIVIVGDDQGVAELCTKEEIMHHPYVAKNRYGTPIVSSILEEGWKYAEDGDICIFLNGDIILNDTICDTLEAFVEQYPDHTKMNYLLTAQRYDWSDFYEIDFENGWFEEIFNSDKINLAESTAIDLFIHRKGTIYNMPQSGIAKYAYDSWILLNAFEKFDLVVDLTETCKIIHHLGKWYQNKMPCPRGTVTRELRMNCQPIYQINNIIKHNTGKKEEITDCPHQSIFQDNKIKIVQR